MNPYDRFSAFEKRLLKNKIVEIEKLNKKVSEDFPRQRALARMTEDEYTIREYNAKSKVTDRDMILLHVDIALDNKDQEQFERLTKQLQGVAK